jgi:molybdate transport system regulatory protein
MTRGAKKAAGRTQEGLGRTPKPWGAGLQQLGEDLDIRAKAWMTAGGETFLAYGRVVLLEGIRDLGSISAAARSIGMSYRRAWWHIETMNRLAKRPLVETSVGGRNGGGAHLTPTGEAAVEVYRRLDARTKTFQASIRRELSRVPK